MNRRRACAAAVPVLLAGCGTRGRPGRCGARCPARNRQTHKPLLVLGPGSAHSAVGLVNRLLAPHGAPRAQSCPTLAPLRASKRVGLKGAFLRKPCRKQGISMG
jgi:hypothetical protein